MVQLSGKSIISVVSSTASSSLRSTSSSISKMSRLSCVTDFTDLFEPLEKDHELVPLTCSNSFKKILRGSLSQKDVLPGVRSALSKRATHTLKTNRFLVEQSQITFAPATTSIAVEYAVAGPEITSRLQISQLPDDKPDDESGGCEEWHEPFRPEAWEVLKQLYPGMSDQDIQAVLSGRDSRALKERVSHELITTTSKSQAFLEHESNGEGGPRAIVVNLSPTTPSTNTAERFYRVPWRSDRPGITTAHYETSSKSEYEKTPVIIDATSSEPQSHWTTADFEERYKCKMSQAMAKSATRTIAWLTTQSTCKDEEVLTAQAAKPVTMAAKELVCRKRDPGNAYPPAPTPPHNLPPDPPTRGVWTVNDSGALYYGVFESLMHNDRPADVLLYAFDRAAAIETQRLHFPEAHHAQVLGKYALAPPRLPEKERTQLQSARIDREAELQRRDIAITDMRRQILQQLSLSVWELQALRLLQGGRLIGKSAEAALSGRRDPGKQASILVLGSSAMAGLGWALAMEYAACDVCTVVKRGHGWDWQGHAGPPNHRVVALSGFGDALPLPAETFDVAVAWGLETILPDAEDSKVCTDRRGQSSVLGELYRVLMPSGKVHFSALDVTTCIALAAWDASSNVPDGHMATVREAHHDAVSAKSIVRRLEEESFVELDTTILGLPTKTGRGRKGEERMDSVAGLVGALAYDRWSLAGEARGAPREARCKQQAQAGRRCVRGDEGVDRIWRWKWMVGSAKKRR